MSLLLLVVALGCSPVSEPSLTAGIWSMLHADGARTVCADTWGIVAEPQLRFDHRSDEPSAFSGPILGEADPVRFGTDHLVYRVLGPGPMALAPPEGIDNVIGTASRVDVFHPHTGEILASREFNHGLFQNFAATDARGAVFVQDIARVQKFAPALEYRLWGVDLGAEVGSDILQATPVGSVAFTSTGDLVVPFMNGRIYLLDTHDGAVLERMDLAELQPPVTPDPQLGPHTFLRNAVASDGDRLFFLVHGEVVVIDHDPATHQLEVVDRLEYGGFSSSTPTLDVHRERLFLVSFDPEDPAEPPQMRCFDYGELPMAELWSVETEVAHFESEDQLTATLVAGEVLVNNALYGGLTAWWVGGDGAEPLWSTGDVLDHRPMMYIASGSEQDRMLYVFDNASRALRGLRADTGEVAWTHEVDTQSIKKPVPFRGTVFLDHNHGLLALQEP